MVYLARRLDHTFHALADSTRRAIVERLTGGPQSISELASRFAMTLPAVSKHVRVLERAGLLSIERAGRVRRCTLATAPLRDAAEWIERHEAYWEASFDRLSVYLEETGKEEEAAAWQTRHRARSTARASKEGSRPRGSGSSARGRRRKR